jgi:hypothetical protein
MVYLATKIGLEMPEATSDYFKAFAPKQVLNPIALIPAVLRLIENPLTEEMSAKFDAKSLDQDETHVPQFDLAFKIIFRSAEWVSHNKHKFFN